MKKVIFIIILLVSGEATSGLAQHKWHVGLKGGVSIPHLTSGQGNSSPLAMGYSSRLGVNTSLLFEVALDQWVSIQPEVCYSEQGGKRSGMQAITNPYPGQIPGKYLWADFRNEAKLH